MIEGWHITTGVHAIIVIIYVWIAAFVFIGLRREAQWRRNPLAVATFFIFATCGLGHGVHVVHTLAPSLGFDAEVGAAARVAMSDPLLVGWTVATGLVGVWYFSMRARLRILHGGEALCVDMLERQRNARKIQADITESLERARDLMAQGRDEEAYQLISAAMDATREIVRDILGADDPAGIQPGDLKVVPGA